MLVWFKDYIADPAEGVWQHVDSVEAIEVDEGSAEFMWGAKVAGVNYFVFTLPENETIMALTPGFPVEAGEPVSFVLEQFETSMLFTAFDQDGELADALAPHVDPEALPPVAGSTTLFVKWFDQYGNLAKLNRGPALEPRELTFEIEIPGASELGWGLHFAVAYIQDDGVDDWADLTEGIYTEEDGLWEPESQPFQGAVPDTTPSLTNNTWRLFVKYTPRPGSQTFIVRVLGWATTPPADATIDFQIIPKLSYLDPEESVGQFTTFSGPTATTPVPPSEGEEVCPSGTPSGTMGTRSDQVSRPYLSSIDPHWRMNVGGGFRWREHGDSNQRLRWAGAMAWMNMQSWTDHLYSLPWNDPPVALNWLSHLINVRFPHNPTADVNSHPALLHNATMFNDYWWSMRHGAPSTHGFARITPKGRKVSDNPLQYEEFTMDWGAPSSSAAPAHHRASRGWYIKVAFNNGVNQPAHSLQVKFVRHAAGYASIAGFGQISMSIEATWSVQRWGTGFGSVLPVTDDRKLYARNLTNYVVPGFAISIPVGVSFEIKPPEGDHQWSDEFGYSKDPYTVSKPGETDFEVGFSVAWAAKSWMNPLTNGTNMHHSIGWADVLLTAAINQTVEHSVLGAENLPAYEWAYARVAYAPPGGQNTYLGTFLR